MEIPDVIAINKTDHPAAKTMLNEVRSILTLDHGARVEAADRAHRGRQRRGRRPSSGPRSRRIAPTSTRRGCSTSAAGENLAGEVFAVASARAKTHLERAVEDDPELRRLLDEVQRRELDPLTAVREIMEKVFKLGDGDGPTLADVEAARERALGQGRPPDPGLRVGDVRADDRSRRAPEGRDPAAHRLVQDSRRRQQARDAERRRAQGGRRRRERRQPRPGGRLGRARGGGRSDDLHAGRDADGQGRADAQLRRSDRADRRDLRRRACRRAALTSRRPARRSSTRSRTRCDRGTGRDRPRARRAAPRGRGRSSFRWEAAGLRPGSRLRCVP